MKNTGRPDKDIARALGRRQVLKLAAAGGQLRRRFAIGCGPAFD
jgi:hypothetical protein